MLNSSGTIVARYSYDPYGKTTLVSGSNLATFQYTGDYAHQPSGLNLTEYRAYDPNTGRWLSRDPIAERGGLNLYRYVYDSPINAVDPFGLGTWHFNVDTSSGGFDVDVYYQLDAEELKCCKEAVVDRYVVWFGITSPFEDRSYLTPAYKGAYTGGGWWEAPDKAHAEADSPAGPSIWYNPWHTGGRGHWYHASETAVFYYKARCTKGLNAGKILSTTTHSFSVPARWDSRDGS